MLPVIYTCHWDEVDGEYDFKCNFRRKITVLKPRFYHFLFYFIKLFIATNLVTIQVFTKTALIYTFIGKQVNILNE